MALVYTYVTCKSCKIYKKTLKVKPKSLNIELEVILNDMNSNHNHTDN